MLRQSNRADGVDLSAVTVRRSEFVFGILKTRYSLRRVVLRIDDKLYLCFTIAVL